MSTHPTMSHPSWPSHPGPIGGPVGSQGEVRHVPHVGDVLLAPSVRLEAADLWAEVGAEVGAEAAALSPRRGAFDPSRVAAARRARATERVLARAAADVVAALGLAGAELRHVSKVRLLERPARGEPLRPLATVRFRSCRGDGSCHLTLRVELRRPGGRLLGTFEIGVHVPAARPDRAGAPDQEPAAA